MDHNPDIHKNTPITRRATPHNKCAEINYFIIMLNYQFTIKPVKVLLRKLTFFDRSPLGEEMVRQYHIRCFESAAEPRYMTSV